MLKFCAVFQNAFANPASFKIPFAVWRDLIDTGTTSRLPSAVAQTS